MPTTYSPPGPRNTNKSGRLLDLAGVRVGKLTVLEHVGFAGSLSVWRCQCDCGRETVLRGSFLNFARNHPENEAYKRRYTHCGCEKKYDGRTKVPGMLLRTGRLSAAWQDFWAFERDCLSIRDGRYLVRLDRTQPLGPDNFLWSECKECWLETLEKCVEILVRTRGETEDSAWERVSSISRQRVFQIIDQDAGLCLCCRRPRTQFSRFCNECQPKRNN